MTKYISHKDTNVLIRKALKEAFPGVKFSVKANHTSTIVAYEGGPVTADVEAVVKRYEGSSFDGMTDMASTIFHEIDGEKVSYGANYVFVERSVSAEGELAAIAYLEAHGVVMPADHETIEVPNRLLWMMQELKWHSRRPMFMYRAELIRFTDTLLVMAEKSGRVF